MLVYCILSYVVGNASEMFVYYLPSSTEGDGRLCFYRRPYVGRYIGMHVCERLPGANSSQIVTKLRQSYPLATGDEVIKFWKVKVGVGGMRSTEPF